MYRKTHIRRRIPCIVGSWDRSPCSKTCRPRTAPHFQELKINELGEPVVELFDAPSGEAALEIFRNNQDIDVLIVDVHMPEMDGFEFLEKLKEERNGLDDLTVFMSCTQASEKGNFREFKGHPITWLLKPVQIRVVQQLLR